MKTWMKNHNILMILLSLILSVILWMYIVGVENPQKDTELRNISIEFQGLEILDDRDLTILSGLEETIDIRVRGRRSDLMDLEAGSTVSVSVDVSGLTSAGTYTLAVKVSLPASVELLRQSATTIDLELESLIERQIDVEVKLDASSTIEEGYMTGSLTSDPETIHVRGPESVVSEIDRAEVVIKRENISSTISSVMDYEFVDAEGNTIDKTQLETNVDQVTATVSVLAVKTVPLKLEFEDGGGATVSNVKCTIKPDKITISGDPETLDGLNYISLGTVDLSQLLTSTTETMDIILPNGLTSVSGEETAVVTLELTGLKTKNVTVNNIEVTGVSDGLTVNLLTNQLVVSIRGTSDAVDMITASNIHVKVDLEGIDLPLGQQTVEAEVTLDGYSDVGILNADYKVNINVTRSEQ